MNVNRALAKKLDRAILIALGHDPDTHDLEPKPDHLWPGIQVRTHDGKPVRFYTAKALRRKGLTVEGVS